MASQRAVKAGRRRPTARSVSPEGWTLPKLARALGLSERTLRRMQEAGDIKPAVPGKGRMSATYDLVAVARACIARPADAREERDRAQAALLRLRVEREEKALVPAVDVARDGRAVVATAAARLQRLPSDLVRQGVVPREREDLVEAVVRESLDELSRLTSLVGAS